MDLQCAIAPPKMSDIEMLTNKEEHDQHESKSQSSAATSRK